MNELPNDVVSRIGLLGFIIIGVCILFLAIVGPVYLALEWHSK